MKFSLHRSQMSVQERAWRSRLAQKVHHEVLIRGTLNVRQIVCGKPGCRCAQGQRHPALYLVYRQARQTHQIYIPKGWEEQVRQWVHQYREVQQLLEKISQIRWQRLRRREL